VVIFILVIWYKARRLNLTKYQSKGINALLIIVGLQFFLGVLTIMFAVPVWLGVLHQVGAFFLLSAMTFTLHRFSK
jgi:cytochrome c oxidase assembly protein subunit 15